MAHFAQKPALKLLHDTSVEDLFKDRKDYVLVHAKASDSVESVVKKLQEYQVLSLPVFSGDEQTADTFEGFVDCLDIASFVICCSPDSDSLTTKTLESLQIAGRAIALVPITQVLLTSRNRSSHDQYTPLNHHSKLSMAVKMFANSMHRAMVTNNEGAAITMLSQSDICNFMTDKLDRGSLKVLGSKTLTELGYGMTMVLTISKSATVLQAVWKLAATGVNALAVVDDAGVLVGNFSASDVKGLYLEKYPHLLENVEEFLQKHSPKALSPKLVEVEKSLLHNVKVLAETGLHHLWSVGTDGKPNGLFTLTDMCSILVNYSE